MAESQGERNPKIMERISNLGSNPKISSEAEQERRTATQRMRAQAAKAEVAVTIQKELDKRGIGTIDERVTVGGKNIDTAQLTGTQANRRREAPATVAQEDRQRQEKQNG